MEQSSTESSKEKRQSEWLSKLYQEWSLAKYRCSSCGTLGFRINRPGSHFDVDPIERMNFTALRCRNDCIHQGGYMSLIEVFNGPFAEKESIRIIEQELNYELN